MAAASEPQLELRYAPTLGMDLPLSMPTKTLHDLTMDVQNESKGLCVQRLRLGFNAAGDDDVMHDEKPWWCSEKCSVGDHLPEVS